MHVDGTRTSPPPALSIANPFPRPRRSEEHTPELQSPVPYTTLFRSLSSDVAAMALGTNTGAAHPVFMSGKEMDPIMKAKVENDASAYLRSFVNARGRNADLAATGIIDSKSFSATEEIGRAHA